MGIQVFVKEEGGGVSSVRFTDVTEVRYEKANRHSAKPDVLVLMKNTESTDWGSYEVVAEIHREDIAGWSRVENLAPAKAGE